MGGMYTSLMPPFTKEGVCRLLQSDIVPGIGKVFAERLTDVYGPEVLEMLMNDPRDITISGLSRERLDSASLALKESGKPLELMAFLYSCGLTETAVGKIIGKYRKRAEEVVLADPYSMVEEVWQLGFYTADKIGRALGIEADDLRRIKGALLGALRNHADQGHLFATESQAYTFVKHLTQAEDKEIALAAGELVEKGKVIRSRGGLYLPVYYNAEKNAARRLATLANSHQTSMPDAEIPSEDIEGHPYSHEQMEAIRMMLSKPVAVLTGGPGTGKTTVLKGILDILEKQDKKICLVAPTGRAAKRMSTLTGRQASTIHRLLGYRQGEGYRNKKLQADVLVIDEGSMLEQVLFDHLLEAVGENTKIIIVGDPDQLPAIGAGNVLEDMVNSGVIPAVNLNENFRQSAGSEIAEGARTINEGISPIRDASVEAGADESKEFIFIEEESKNLQNRILELASVELPAKYGISATDIQIVTPQQMGKLGARLLNPLLQQKINPEGPSLKRGQTEFRVGDPVMQTSNSKAREVYNGEVGRITAVDEEGKHLTVEFSDGHTSVYSRTDLSELTLAYATTVHKLQGSEVDYMIMVVTMAHKPMLYRQLLYTGVSRARKLCVVIGEKEALEYGIGNAERGGRNSKFGERLADGKLQIGDNQERRDKG